ncbi:unnamed protein product [Pseudo-nitzschia multistriata]|uniref:Uncharacterized protein n=1 Tax=Pseudo-nitzschia multistriata TaxID=183589 RepID=A0A448Z7Q1_9STRA|nr:unnamed protein product [Pseudo-nitzschia multistriata]
MEQKIPSYLLEVPEHLDYRLHQIHGLCHLMDHYWHGLQTSQLLHWMHRRKSSTTVETSIGKSLFQQMIA